MEDSNIEEIPQHEPQSAQPNDAVQRTLPGSNIETMMQQMMRQMMTQMNELTARIARIETTETPTNTVAPTPAASTPAAPTPAVPTPTTQATYTHESKGLKDPEPFDGTRSQYLPWKYQVEAKLRSEPRRFHTNQLAIDYTFSRTTGDARARIFP